MNKILQVFTLQVCAAALVGIAGASPAWAQDAPALQTNQAYVEEVSGQTALDANDVMAVFGYVMSKLPERVKVYPTENYYYFWFIHNGIRYAGNIRLDASNRDEGKVVFAYFEDTSVWYEEAAVKHKILGAADGVKLEKVEDLVYKLGYKDKSVTFALNDLRGVKPPAGALSPDEVFLGPIFDESAIQFYLVFNKKLKLFHYLLNESAPVPDQFFSPKAKNRVVINRITIGKRTGFAFYKDHRRNRKILVGAYEGNMRANNYFDGPFDQLPDNFIEGDALRDAILSVRPQLKGTIDRFGGTPDGSIRFNIGPYMPYNEVTDLNRINACAVKKQKQADYYRCFVSEENESGGMPPAKQSKSSRPAR
jgi:hypothetical protein